MKILVKVKGGPGSGNFSRTHFGRPGMRGGSVAVGSGFETDTIANLHTYVDKKFAGHEDLHTAVRQYDKGLLTEEEIITALGMTPKQYKMRIEGKYAADAEAEVRTEKLEREFQEITGDYRFVDKYIKITQEIEEAGHTIEHYEQELDKSLRDPDLLENIPPSPTSALHNTPISHIEDITAAGEYWIRDMDDAYQAKSTAMEIADNTGIKKTPVYRRIMEDTFPLEEARAYLASSPDILTTNFPVAKHWKENISKAYQSLPRRDQQQFVSDLASASRNWYILDLLPYQGESIANLTTKGVNCYL